MKILPVTFLKNNERINQMKKQDDKSSVPFLTSDSNNYILPVAKSYHPVFRGLQFENDIVKKVEDKEYQGLGLYKDGVFIDFNKVGWENLSKEQLDIKNASYKEIYAFYHALALAETNDSTWVRRYNKFNVTVPLATFHSLNSEKSKKLFANNLKELHNFSHHKMLDVPITDKNDNLAIDCIVFDTETTGLNLTNVKKPLDKIIQIGAIQLKKGKIAEETAFNQLINPEMHISDSAAAVHGITDEMVADKPTMEKVIGPFVNDYMNKRNGVIVAYNSKFDITILNNAIGEHNSYSSDTLKPRPTYKVLDPFILVQRIHPYMGARKKLSEQYKFLFGKNLDDAHDAFADVKGTVDVLKYCLYYLNDHRKNKDIPLTLREVLVFQNGGKVENLDLPLDYQGCNANVNFNKSYVQVPIAVDNYFDGYKLTKKTLNEIREEVGEDNYNKLKGEKDKLYNLTPKDGYPINPEEMKMQPKGGGVENAFYVMKKNFKKVLGFMHLEPYNGKSEEELIDFITEKSKHYIHNNVVDVWMKNPNPVDIKDGNDLPDIKIAKKVMMEKTESSPI